MAFSINSYQLQQEILAVNTIFCLHKFLKQNNKNPVYDPMISCLAAQPYTVTTCRTALSLLENNFINENFKIKVEKQRDSLVPHFQTLMSEKESNQPPSQLLIISLVAKRALEWQRDQLLTKEGKKLSNSDSTNECCEPINCQCILF